MKELEAHEPFLASEILRNILRASSAARVRLEREVTALETSTLKGSKDPTKGLGQSILAKIATPPIATYDVGVMEKLTSGDDISVGRRHHHFQHISVGGPSAPKKLSSLLGNSFEQPSEALQDNQTNLVEIRPHLSRPMEENVVDCFMRYSEAVDKCKDSEVGLADDNLSYYPLRPGASRKSQVCATITRVGERRIKIEELQRAVMDLGFFPTTDEIQLMQSTLGPTMMQRLSSKEHAHGASIKEFLSMIEVLSFAELSEEQRQLLFKLFNRYCDKHKHLRREGLSSLMRALGHPEDELELQLLMHEWDVFQRGYLDFSDFISIVAHVMKSEALDAKVEHDFLQLCGKEVSEIENNRESLLKSLCSYITAEDLIRAGRERDMPIDPEIAEEMIFDASESGDKKVLLEELIDVIETVYKNESLSSKKPGVPNHTRRITARELIPGFISS